MSQPINLLGSPESSLPSSSDSSANPTSVNPTSTQSPLEKLPPDSAQIIESVNQYNGPDSKSFRRNCALKALLERKVDESLDSVAKRAGISDDTLRRYIAEEEFQKEYKKRIDMELAMFRSPVAMALVKNATNTSVNNFSGIQRLYWERVGDIGGKGTRLEINNSNNNNVNNNKLTIAAFLGLDPNNIPD